MSLREKFVADVEAFIKRHDMHQTTFGLLSCRDGSFYARIKAGTIGLKRMERAREFMDEYDKKKRLARRERQQSVAA